MGRYVDQSADELTVGAHDVVDTSGNTEKGEDTGEGLGTLAGGSDGLARTVRAKRNKVSCGVGAKRSKKMISKTLDPDRGCWMC